LGIRLVGARTSKIFTMNDPVRVRIEDVSVAGRDVVGSLQEHHTAEAPTEVRRRQRHSQKKTRDEPKPKPKSTQARKRSRRTRKR
jgi:hypothetical protein